MDREVNSLGKFKIVRLLYVEGSNTEIIAFNNDMITQELNYSPYIQN